MRRLVAALALASLTLAAAAVSLGATIDVGTRTVSASAITARWSLANPEAIVELSWNGSPNLTQAWPHPFHCSSSGHEFFGNAWVTDNDFGFTSFVGWGSQGSWNGTGDGRITIASSASGCFGTTGLPVRTRYTFYDGRGAANKLRIQRTFSFGATSFDRDFRPYIPRLYPRDAYTQVLHPDAAGAALVAETAAACEFGCLVTNWDGSWFAIHDPAAGRGMVVRSATSAYATALWIDVDGGSWTNSSSLALRSPTGGFTGEVTDVQFLCFYDEAVWTPGLTPPAGC